MHAVTQSFGAINHACIEPIVKWTRSNKTLLYTLAVSLLLGGIVCYHSPQTFELMKKNVKFLTVIIPIAYTLTFPLVLTVFVVGTENPYGCHQGAHKLFQQYTESIVKVWQLWFNFVGLP